MCMPMILGSDIGSSPMSWPSKDSPQVHQDFTAQHPNQLWLSDITEHATTEAKLYLCAVKDVFSNRIVGYSIDSRMIATGRLGPTHGHRTPQSR